MMINSVVPHSMEMTGKRKPVPKPLSIITYNQNMGAVDHSDKVTKPLVTERKTIKWYKKVYFHLVDLGVYNSYIIWKFLDSSRKKIGYQTYLLTLIHEILQENHQERKRMGRPVQISINSEDTRQKAGILDHLPDKVFKPNGKPWNKDCRWCSGKVEHNSAVSNKENQAPVRHLSPFVCITCQIHLCVQGPNSCFTQFHKVAELPTRKRKIITEECHDEDEIERKRRESRFYASSP